ncbi:MAG: glycosyltransferase family 4 protein [Firmicutes bacterium]|nr:glycosyltransferase family 4 protein [Bacillota bacterium]
MRIGVDIDILTLPNPYTGIPNYLRHLANGLAQFKPDVAHFYLLSRRQVYENDILPAHVSPVVVRWPLGWGWQSVVLPCAAWWLRFDLLHMPAFAVPPFVPCPVVVTVHDLAYLTHPEWCREETVSYLSRRVPRALRKASAVITPSAFVRDEVVRCFGVPTERIHPILHGVSPAFRVLPKEEVTDTRQEMGLPERFLLYVGTIEPRKNLLGLIQAFGQAVAQGLDHSLVIAGAKGWKCTDIYALPRQLGLEHRVLFPGYVPGNLLPALYNAATIFVYPSLYEGFGLPVLEAMACGTPVVASNVSSLPEVVGEAGILVNPLDKDELASAILVLASNEGMRQDLSRKGLEWAAQFSWERTAQETVRVYETCSNHATRDLCRGPAKA